MADFGESSPPPPSSMQQQPPQTHHHLRQQPAMVMIPTPPSMQEHQTDPLPGTVTQDQTHHHQQLQLETVVPPNLHTPDEQQQVLPEFLMPPASYTTQNQQLLLPELTVPPENINSILNPEPEPLLPLLQLLLLLQTETVMPPISNTTHQQHQLPINSATGSADMINSMFNQESALQSFNFVGSDHLQYTDGSSPSVVGAGGSNMYPRPMQYLPPNRYSGRRRTPAHKQLDALGPAGRGFTPHVIIIHPGEDVRSLITSFSQQSDHRAVSVIVAHGRIRKITFRSPGGDNVTMEGQFVIIGLSSGSFTGGHSEGSHDQSAGNLSVSFADSEAKVWGGEVVGPMIAETTIQLVLGSYVTRDGKTPKYVRRSSAAAPPQIGSSFGDGGTVSGAILVSDDSSSESSEDSDSDTEPDQPHLAGSYNNADIEYPPSTPILERFPDMGWSD